MLSERRSVSLTSTGPDGVVIEVEVSAPDDLPLALLRARLDVFATGQPTDVAIGDVWISGRALR